MSQIIRLLIADDHPVVRDGLRGIFEASGEFEVAGEAANGREAVDRAAALQPDVVLMDLRMPVLDGVSAIRMLAEKGVSARVLVLTTFDTDTDVVPAIEAGATGYLLKDSPPDELLRGVRAAARGEAVLSPSVATRLLGQVRQPAREPLSERELDILGLIAAGLLDELCLTIGPLMAGPGASRIVAGTRAAPLPLRLAHVLEDQGFLLCRYTRSEAA